MAKPQVPYPAQRHPGQRAGNRDHSMHDALIRGFAVNFGA
jgi:hypothetical protein